MIVQTKAMHSEAAHSLVPAVDPIVEEQFETPSLTADDLDAIAAYFKREAMETARHRTAHWRRRNSRSARIHHSRAQDILLGSDA
jgi:hypothetical protein